MNIFTRRQQYVMFETSYKDPYPLQVVSDSSYREEIEEVTGYIDSDRDIHIESFVAQLILDEENLEDPGNAVAIEINGESVGRLSKSDAKKYRTRLLELGLSDVVGECGASIQGGQAEFIVRLDIIIASLRPQPIPGLKSLKPLRNRPVI